MRAYFSHNTHIHTYNLASQLYTHTTHGQDATRGGPALAVGTAGVSGVRKVPLRGDAFTMKIPCGFRASADDGLDRAGSALVVVA